MKREAPLPRLPSALTPQAYEERVKVAILAQVAALPTSGDLPGNTLYTLRTNGMPVYHRPEMEVVDVPALWVEDAGRFLNEWAFYSIVTRPILEGQTLAGGLHRNVKLRATMVQGVLQLKPEAVKAACSGCGGPTLA